MINVRTCRCVHDAESHDPFYGCLMPDCYCAQYPKSTPAQRMAYAKAPSASRRFWGAVWVGVRFALVVFWAAVLAAVLLLAAGAGVTWIAALLATARGE